MCKVLNFVIVYISITTLIFSQTIPAYAGIIGTDQFMAQLYVDQDRELLYNKLDRHEVLKLLKQHGVSTKQAQERIDAMTNEEVRILAQKFEELPAAGSIGTAAAILILALVVIALVLSR